MVHKAETPEILCINKSRGESKDSYTQEDVKKTVKVNAELNCHGIQRNEINENNVAVQKLELGQGRDPGVRSTPFVKSGERVRSKNFENVISDNFYAKPEDVYAYHKIPEYSGIAEEQKVSENVTYVENAIVEKVLLFVIDSSPSGNVINVYDACAKGLCSCEYKLGGENT